MDGVLALSSKIVLWSSACLRLKASKAVTVSGRRFEVSAVQLILVTADDIISKFFFLLRKESAKMMDQKDKKVIHLVHESAKRG